MTKKVVWICGGELLTKLALIRLMVSDETRFTADPIQARQVDEKRNVYILIHIYHFLVQGSYYEPVYDILRYMYNVT